jgi:hypothetical protein
MHILASGPELQAVRLEYVILGKNWKKGGYPWEDLIMFWEQKIHIKFLIALMPADYRLHLPIAHHFHSSVSQWLE